MNHCLVRCLASRREYNWYDLYHRDSNRRDSNWCWYDLNQCDSEFQNFCANFFKFKIILALRVVENSVDSRVFTFTFLWTMIQPAHVGKILRSPDEVKEVEAPLPGNLWYYSYNGYWCIRTDAIITNPPVYSYSHFRTTLQTFNRDVPITVSSSGNGSGQLVVVNEGWVTDHIVQRCSRTPEGLQSSYSTPQALRL